MAIEAKLHVERLGFPSKRHPVQVTVALGTANAAVDMNAVVEKDEVWDKVYTVPSQRRIGGQALPHGREDGCIGIKLGMTGHAGFGGGHAREGGFLD